MFSLDWWDRERDRYLISRMRCLLCVNIEDREAESSVSMFDLHLLGYQYTGEMVSSTCDGASIHC